MHESAYLFKVAICRERSAVNLDVGRPRPVTVSRSAVGDAVAALELTVDADVDLRLTSWFHCHLPSPELLSSFFCDFLRLPFSTGGLLASSRTGGFRCTTCRCERKESSVDALRSASCCSNRCSSSSCFLWFSSFASSTSTSAARS